MANVTMDTNVTEDPLYYLQQQIRDTRFVCLKILMPTVVSFGVIGNIMNISVLTRRWMRSSTNYYLSALAICDINYLILAFTLTIVHYDQAIPTSMIYMRYMVHIGQPVINIFSNTGVWLTLTFTVERYIGVCHPMKGKVWCTPQRAKYIILAVATTSTLITFPNFFEYTVIVKNTTGILTPEQTETDFGKSISLVYTWVNQILFTFAPLILLSIFNSLLVNAVTSATKKRRAMTKVTVQNERQERHMREQHKITLMLIAVVIVFLICQLPQAISHLYEKFIREHGKWNKETEIKFRIAGNVCNLLVMINSSVNFVLYSSFSLKFRRTFKVLFCRCLWSQNRPRTFIFSEVFSQAADTRSGVRSKGTSSPYTSSPIRPATSYVSINGTTPICSPSPSLGNINKLTKSKNGYLSVSGDGVPEYNLSSCV